MTSVGILTIVSKDNYVLFVIFVLCPLEDKVRCPGQTPRLSGLYLGQCIRPIAFLLSVKEKRAWRL